MTTFRRPRHQHTNWLLLVTITLWFSSHIRCADDFLSKFQTEIDTLPNEVDTLILHIDQNVNPEETSSVMQPIELCVRTSEEYVDFWSIVNNFDSEIDNPSITIDNGECKEIDEINKLKLWILEIKNKFYEVLTKSPWSNAYIDLKISYEHKLTQYSKNIDTIAKVVQSTNGKNAISKLRLEYTTLEGKIRAFFNRIQNEKRLLNEKAAELCANELKANRIDSALKMFNDIEEERLARQIVLQAYENDDSFQRLFDFIERLDSAAVYYGYQGLFMRMASKNRWFHLNSLIFLSGVDRRRGSEYQSIRNTLQIKLKPYFETGDHADFYAAVNSRTVDFGLNVMPTYVRLFYKSDVGNVVKILDVRNKFDQMRHKLDLIDSLIKEMKIQDHTKKPEFFMILSDLIDLKSQVNKESNEIKQIYNHIINDKLPSNVLALMNSNLCIQNFGSQEIMHASSDGQRQIVTSHQFDKTFNFEAEFLDRGRSLILKNVHFGQYLSVAEGQTPRQLILTKDDPRNDKRSNFMIEVIDFMSVRIKNVQFNEFLYASESIVQTESEVTDDGLWRLISCSNI